MKLTYRGINYDIPSIQINRKEKKSIAKYRGRDYDVIFPLKFAQKSSLGLKYRGKIY
jgi:hypothetical protein